ncbi:MAG: iron ABC transporter permease [Candidatus Aminicenantales bacterium]
MNKRVKFLYLVLFLLPLVVFFFSFNIGSYPIPFKELMKTLLSPLFPSLKHGLLPVYSDIVFGIRFPRLLLALAIGASLSVSGASLQALFKNPLVNEYILGISSGAAFGASISLVFLRRGIPTQAAAFFCALVAVFIVLFVARNSESPLISLLLTGVIVSAFFSALLALVEFFASPYSLQALFYWLMGNLALATWKDLAVSLPIMAFGVTLLILLRWRMNVLSLSDEEAQSIGINVRVEKMLIILVAALTTSAATAVAGIIGWIGLIVPHLVRMMVGVDNRRVIPLSAAVGASLLILADDITRAIASYEIPVGIFTSLIGIPFFIVLLKKSKRTWL